MLCKGDKYKDKCYDKKTTISLYHYLFLFICTSIIINNTSQGWEKADYEDLLVFTGCRAMEYYYKH